MAGIRRTLTLLALGSAMISRAASAQPGSSVSLTHTVTVTVPPRVKVQVTSAAPTVQRAGLVASSQTTIDGLALSVSATQDRKSTRLNSSHTVISYAVFCLKKKKK